MVFNDGSQRIGGEQKKKTIKRRMYSNKPDATKLPFGDDGTQPFVILGMTGLSTIYRDGITTLTLSSLCPVCSVCGNVWNI